MFSDNRVSVQPEHVVRVENGRKKCANWMSDERAWQIMIEQVQSMQREVAEQ